MFSDWNNELSLVKNYHVTSTSYQSSLCDIAMVVLNVFMILAPGNCGSKQPVWDSFIGLDPSVCCR